MIIEDIDTSSSSGTQGIYRTLEEDDMVRPSVQDTWDFPAQFGRHLRIVANDKSPKIINFSMNIDDEKRRQLFEKINNHIKITDTTF